MFDLCCDAVKIGICKQLYGIGQARNSPWPWPGVQDYHQFGFNYRAGPQTPRCLYGNGYTVKMNSEVIERLETKLAFLESANVELSDVVYRQSLEIQRLRARLDALTQRVEAAQPAET